MQWYEDEAYVGWQRNDGTHSKYLQRAMRYAKHEVEGDDERPKKVKNEVAAAAVQLNSEYSAWRASMVVERQRCILYVETIANYSMSIEREEDEEIDERLKATSAIAARIANDMRQAKHWANVWKEDPPSGNKEKKAEVDESDEE